ncbi:MAG: glycosyltransferase [Terrimicrobiaceae bacterium]
MNCTIITPSFRQFDWLRLCVASIRDQVSDEAGVESRSSNNESLGTGATSTRRFSPLRVEHIIQDAGTPGVEEFAREIGADFYRNGIPISRSPLRIPNYILAIYSERDNGMYDAINRGLRKGSGEICAWLNCDEQYLPDTLKKMAVFFREHPGVEVAAGDTILLNESLEPKAYRKAVAPDRRYIQVFQMNLHSSSLFFRKSILERGHWLGSRFRSIGDAEWVAELLDSKVRFYCVRDPLSTFVLGSENLSGNAISEEESALWRSEINISASEKLLLKAQNWARRIACGAYLPRRATISIFTQRNTRERTRFSERWLDFRFCV